LVRRVIIFVILNVELSSFIWTPQVLAKHFKSFGFTDPENLIQDKDLFKKIQKEFILNNKILSKIDTNVFFISEISDEYEKLPNLFALTLHVDLDFNEDYSKYKKSNYLTIIFVTKQNLVIIYPTNKVAKLFTENKIKAIKKDVTLKMTQQGLIEATVSLFQKLNIHLREYNEYQNEGIISMGAFFSNILNFINIIITEPANLIRTVLYDYPIICCTILLIIIINYIRRD
jgi:hypothetical protein